MDDNGMEKSAYRLVLQYENSTDILRRIAETPTALDPSKLTGSNLRLFEAYNAIYEFINEWKDDQELRNFFMYFYKN